jgi:DNA-binding NtrC family response regulator
MAHRLLLQWRMKARMLVIEDDDSTIRSMQRFFEFQGFRVDSARELEEAEALLSNYAYEIVISGVRLHAAHGSEGLRILAYAHEQCPSTRTVMLGVSGHTEIEDEARSRGIDVLERGLPSFPTLARRIFGMLGAAS